MGCGSRDAVKRGIACGKCYGESLVSGRHVRQLKYEAHQKTEAFGRLRRLPCAYQPENGAQSALQQNRARQTMLRNIQGWTREDLERMSVLRCDGKRGQPGLRRMFRVWLASVSLNPAQRLRHSHFLADLGTTALLSQYGFCRVIPRIGGTRKLPAIHPFRMKWSRCLLRPSSKRYLYLTPA